MIKVAKMLCFWVMCLLSSSGFAQTDSSEYETDEQGEVKWITGNMNQDKKFGLRLGSHLSTMLGGELTNPRLQFGLNGSVYYRIKYKPTAAVQADLGFSIRGSNFNNQIGEYDLIRTYYLDVPIMWVKSINSTQTTHFLIGAQYSWLLNASIYVKPNALPESQSPQFKKNDVLALSGVQFYGGFVGFQVIAKYGLININDGLINGLNPPLKNKDIHNFALEVNLLF